jgi:hypothetical protein
MVRGEREKERERERTEKTLPKSHLSLPSIDLQSPDWDILGTTIAFNMMQRFESSDPQTDPACESYRLIKQHVGWKSSLLNLDALLAALLELFISVSTSAPSVSKLPPEVFSAIKALELMGVFAGWEWTYERLIRQIWTVMNKAPPPLFGAILKLMGRLAQQGLVESDAQPSDALYDLRLKFAHILDPGSGAKRCMKKTEEREREREEREREREN